jgi:hypothetical protein
MPDRPLRNGRDAYADGHGHQNHWLVEGPRCLGRFERPGQSSTEPIVTRNQWDAAQTPVGARSRGTSMLPTGLAPCASYRYRLKGRSKTGVYQCHAQKAIGICPASVAISGLEARSRSLPMHGLT